MPFCTKTRAKPREAICCEEIDVLIKAHLLKARELAEEGANAVGGVRLFAAGGQVELGDAGMPFCTKTRAKPREAIFCEELAVETKVHFQKARELAEEGANAVGGVRLDVAASQVELGDAGMPFCTKTRAKPREA